jgi:hypothetical protein
VAYPFPEVGDEPALTCFGGASFKRGRVEGVSLTDNNQALLMARSALGSEAEFGSPLRHVRFVPKVSPYTWVAKKALTQLTEHQASFKKYPPIPPGTLDLYVPPKAE